jgi:SAM-dependent methyltransferase
LIFAGRSLPITEIPLNRNAAATIRPMSAYTVRDYGDMIADRARMHAYAEAIRARVTSDSVVLDLGAGPGIFTLMACQAGARKVYAVEADGIIQIARELAVANGYGDRVECIQAVSTAVTLPERVDLVVSDLNGVLPFYRQSLASIIDARNRFLKHGGALIPEREAVYASIVKAPSTYKRVVEPWDNIPGLDCTAARARAVNDWKQCLAVASALVVAPAVWCELDFALVNTTNAKATVRWTMEEEHEAHGLCLWFDCQTGPGLGFSNAPGVDCDSVYQQGFFPWPSPCRLAARDEITVEIRADLVGEDYIWSWNTEIRSSGSQSLKAKFRQSRFLSAAVSQDWLRKSGASFVPTPNQEARIDKMILDLLFAGLTLEEIARQVAERFPERFPEWRPVLTRVADLSLRYSQ